MSLIIASNVNLKDKPATSEIHKAYSWSNRLTSTFKVEKDSEIAVQSVKINKNGLLSVGSSNSNYALYIGSDVVNTFAVANSMEDSVNHPVADSVVRGTAIKDLTVDEYAREIQSSFQKNVMNPAFYSTTTGTPAVSVTPKTTAEGAFAGYKFSVAQDAATEDVVPPDTSAQSVFPTSRFTYTGGVMERVTAVAPEVDGTTPTGACAIFLDKPVLLSSPKATPSVNYDITDAVGSGISPPVVTTGTWACGLTRNSTKSPLVSPTTGNNIGFAPPYYDPDNAGSADFTRFKYMFFDFCAVKDRDSKLRIYQSCVDTSSISGDQLVMREVIYTSSGNSVFKSGLYDLAVNATEYTHIRFRVENEGVICEIGKHATGAYDIVVDTTIGDKRNMFYPRSILQNFLYPQIFIGRVGTAIGFEDRYTYTSMPSTFNPDSPDVDFVARLLDTGKYMKWGKAIENREHNDFNTAYGNDAFPYEGFEPYGGGGGGWLQGTQMNLIMAPNQDYGIEYTADANTQFSFGFAGRSLAKGTVDAVGGSAFESTTTPVLSSSNSLFVRINNLTQQSVNAQLGNAYSKIIGHLPRFDSAGNEIGSLYFEPNELVYIALKNPNEIFLNSFDIDIVYDNESYAEVLSGKTIVVLHIRKRRS